MKGKDLVKLLKRNGWELVRINGSHHIMAKNKKVLSVPCHSEDLKPGTYSDLLKKAELK